MNCRPGVSVEGCVKNKRQKTPGTQKVRRDATGGKRGQGNKTTRRARRADPTKIHVGRPDRSLSSVAGLVGFGVFLKAAGVDHELTELFERLKAGRSVIYPMGFQLRLGIDLLVSGEARLFGVEALASDGVFEKLTGGMVPSVDTLYDDFARFDERALSDLEAVGARHGLTAVRKLRDQIVYLDVDTSVLPLDGEHEGGVPGPNPKFHGRPSYHPIVARVAATDTIVGAQLRRGDTGFGADDVPTVIGWTERLQKHVRKRSVVCVRIDAAGDCTEFLQKVDAAGAFYLTKARVAADLLGAVATHSTWRTTDRDAFDRPTRQVAELAFRRKAWDEAGLGPVRVIAVRSQDRQGKQLYLSDEIAWTVQVFLTNRMDEDIDDVAWSYDRRAGIEPLIAELKGAWGIGAMAGYSFASNHGMLLLKVLTHNLLRRYARDNFPRLGRWRTPWLRRTLIRVPGRLSRSGRSMTLHLPVGSHLHQRE